MSDNELQTRENTGAVSQEIGKLPRLQPPADIFENAEGYLIRADIPGVAEDGVDIRYDKGELVFEARRPWEGSGTNLGQEFGPVLYRRAFRIPEAIDAQKIEARLRFGVLELELPKSEELKPRQIPVVAG
jgi:HSP20 family protein